MIDIEKRLADLEARVTALEGAKAAPVKQVASPIVVSPPALVAQSDFEALKELVMAESWPAAVDPALICNVTSEQDKEDRAEGILDLIIDVHLENLSFLDFGCGEGHVVKKSIKQKPKIAVGYDVVESPRWAGWEKQDNMVFGTNWEEVVKHAPYNVILLYDVLDHMEGDTAKIVETLRKIKALMAPNAKVFARCHPWCSRHASHMYHELNKAYVHLVFTPEELESMGYKNKMFNRTVIHPLAMYGDWFRMAGLKVSKRENVTRENVEKFFSQVPMIANRIKSHWKSSPEKELREGRRFPTVQMEMQFIDYVLN